MSPRPAAPPAALSRPLRVVVGGSIARTDTSVWTSKSHTTDNDVDW